MASLRSPYSILSMKVALLVAVCAVTGISSVIVPPDSLDIYFSGRTERIGHNNAVAMDWPGSRIIFAVVGSSSCTLYLNETQTNRWAVFLRLPGNDGYVLNRTFTASGVGRYQAFTGLIRSQNIGVMLVKTTEACGSHTGCPWGVFGTATFGGLELEPGARLKPPHLPWRHDRRLLFVGDSITVGWGALGQSRDHSSEMCNDAEDHWEAWGAQLSRLLHAEFHSVAWSGIGLIRGDDAGTNRSIRELMMQSLANNPQSRWDPAQWVPSAALVHLGTNDFCPKYPAMDREAFAQQYVELLLRMTKQWNRQLRLFIACGPMGTTGDPEYGKAYFPCDVLDRIAALGAGRGLHVNVLNFGGLFNMTGSIGGCDHPSTQTHAAMAALAQPIVARAMGWN